ncbi:MAG: M1 family metallopeptidase [Planctomycetota bacterium]
MIMIATMARIGALVALPIGAPLRADAMDTHSHSRPAQVRVKHVSLDLTLDFNARQARGSVRLDCERHDPGAPLVLDARGIAIEAVSGSDGSPRAFELSPEDVNLGSALAITLAPGDHSVSVRYHTTERADALQWLTPEQTAGKKQPFLFTQGESIFTRTWIPLQDSPSVRVTYDATIRAPAELTAVMSAEQLGKGSDGAFHFRMTQKIAPYLIALACGDLAFRPISKRCGVWAEPSVVDAAAGELADTEAMVARAESVFGPYRWGRYDLLILPPAFPFGGMENPCLTFATPTILAGDKSLVSLVAHELAHSWSGNLVTNATWSDFWLNEGFTVYLEGRIMEAVFGAERYTMETVLGIAELENEMQELEPRDQILHVDLKGRHPDDGFSSVPYQKGAALLERLAEVFGRKNFDQFLAAYFAAHEFESITTEEFLGFLERELLRKHPDLAPQVDLDLWVYQPGLPPDLPRPRSVALERVDRTREAWQQGSPASALDTSGWVTQQWLRFLEGLPATVSAEQLADLDRAFHVTATGNCELLCTWLRLGIEHGYGPSHDRLLEFLMNVGRRKYLKPLYAAMAKTDAGLKEARAIYAKARPRYHAVSSGTLDKILRWSAAKAQ